MGTPALEVLNVEARREARLTPTDDDVPPVRKPARPDHEGEYASGQLPRRAGPRGHEEPLRCVLHRSRKDPSPIRGEVFGGAVPQADGGRAVGPAQVNAARCPPSNATLGEHDRSSVT